MTKEVKPTEIKPKKMRLDLPGQKKHANIKEALAHVKETLEQIHLDELRKHKK